MENTAELKLNSKSYQLPIIEGSEHERGIDISGRSTKHFDRYRRTTFDRVPDVPVTKFVLTLPGGKHGLLVASRNLCAKPVKGIIQLKGQNGKKANRHMKLRTPCKGKHGKKHKKPGAKQHK